ncbi:hypothetical protein SUGI_0713610 [Cryptomeria japonica]|nr:hypothetical protein SUGI_0713610 [Cryptomeria japonica]
MLCTWLYRIVNSSRVVLSEKGVLKTMKGMPLRQTKILDASNVMYGAWSEGLHYMKKLKQCYEEESRFKFKRRRRYDLERLYKHIAKTTSQM